MIFFPIFIGHWTLLEVDTDDLCVHFYDIGKTEKYLESILISCYQFLQQEFYFHKGKEKDLEHMKTLRYETTDNQTDIDEQDSAVFILMKIKKYAVPQEDKKNKNENEMEVGEDEYNQSCVQDFKERLVKLLIENCERI